MKIGHKVFGQNSLNYGLALCLWRNNITTQSVTEKTAPAYDVILFSIFWWQHVIDFYKFCETAKIGKCYSDSPRLVVGGFNSFNPVLFKKYAHVVVVGDGEDIILKAIRGDTSLSFYTGNENEVIYNQCDISDNQFIYTNESKICRIEIARGCPYHCKFCQLSAMKKYRELSCDKLEAMLSHTGKRIALFSPNKTSHKEFPRIKSLVENMRKTDVVPDVRFNDVEKFYTGGTYQIGIEGISERLRFSVGKKLTNERYREIVSYVVQKSINEGKKPNIHVGYILDLPTETEEDWNEFTSFLDSLQMIKNIQYFDLFFVFNMFMPAPFTPLENARINYEREYQPKIRKALKWHEGNRKYSVALHGRLFSGYSRILSMITTRGGEDTPEIINTVEREKSIKNLPDCRKILPLKYILKSFGGIERFVGEPKERPWDIVKISHGELQPEPQAA